MLLAEKFPSFIHLNKERMDAINIIKNEEVL